MKSTVILRHIFVSGGHNFFGHNGQPPGSHPTVDVPAVGCRAGWGLEGDRFYGYRPDYGGQVTFFAYEVFEEIKRELALPLLGAEAFRRNIIIEGAHLNSLVGMRFSLCGLEFEGTGEARPCTWMNHAVGNGAERWLRGRGGLRAKILTDGILRRGATELCAGGLLPLG